MIKFLLLLFCVLSASSQKGFALVEVIQSRKLIKQFKDKGYTFTLQVINKAKETTKATQNLKYAKEFNMTADLFFIGDQNIASLDFVDNLLSSIPSNLFGMVWIHVSEEFTVNCFYLKQVVQKIKSRGKKVGISTSLYDWNIVIGNQCQEMSKQQLMYIGINQEPNFDDFITFGGWERPTLKIYEQVIVDITFMYVNIYSP